MNRVYFDRQTRQSAYKVRGPRLATQDTDRCLSALRHSGGDGGHISDL